RLVALEVDHPVEALVPAAAPPRRQLAAVVAAAGAVQVLGQRTIRLARRDLVEGERRLAAHAGRGRVVLANRHDVLRSLQEVGQLLAVPQPHVRLFPVRAAADVLALALELAVRQRRADALHLRAEQRLDGLLDVDLVGVHRHLEHQRAAVLADDRGLLGDQWPTENVGQFPDYPSASCRFSIAARVSPCRRELTTSRALTRLLARTRTPSMLRTDSDSLSSGFTSTSNTLLARLAPSTPSRLSISAAAFVLISATLSASTTVTSPSRSFCVSAARSAPFSTFFGSWYS